MLIRDVKRAAAAAVLAVMAALALSACGGSDLDGAYYDRNGKIIIDGSSVTYHTFGCQSTGKSAVVINDKAKRTGELNDAGDQVIWSGGGGTEAITVSESGDTVDIGGKQYSAMDEKEAMDGYKRMCGQN
ncbi:hypothetical protein ACFOY4_35100 [Actinomadura syzygii]|uniref:DUF3060 domain-containing protein n=1 Tax=Actinomadura syzygii TaxID=1427538 RepID=A0A5D0U0H3_9ACTN|nr:hypothetical protein [Actinomadura syzygii]TYC11210.1 hypothetical protein FXF65_30185 [Actinomadura syzygii]